MIQISRPYNFIYDGVDWFHTKGVQLKHPYQLFLLIDLARDNIS